MKITTKMFLALVLILTISFNIGSSIFITSNFNHSLNLYKDTALTEYITQYYMLQSEISTHISQGVSVNSSYISNLIDEKITTGLWDDKFINIIFNDVILFENKTITIPDIPNNNTVNSSIIKAENDDGIQYLYVMYSTISLQNDDITFVLGNDITMLYQERTRQINIMSLISIFINLISNISAFIILKIITKNIKKLTTATNIVSTGDYSNFIEINSKDEIGELARNFNLMLKAINENINKLDAYAKSRDEFVTNFSHELKTPLTSIIGYSDMLRRKYYDDEISNEAISYINSQGQRLAVLSQKMLELMQLKEAQIALKLENLYDIIKQSIIAVTPSLDNKNIQIQILCDINIKCYCDKDLIQTLIINLLDNAIKYSKDNDKIEVKVKVKDELKDTVIIQVKDYGIGVASEKIQYLTDVFYMTDISRKGNSTGVGLAICNEIARVHATNLDIKSEINSGMEVEFKLRGEAIENEN